MINRLTIAGNRVRRLLPVVIVVLLVVTAANGAAWAQGSTSRKIKVGDTVTGTLDAKNFAQVYSFDDTAKASVTIEATTKVSGLNLGLLLTDATGATLNSVPGTTSATSTIKDFVIPADGTYYVTVIRGAGAQNDATGDFSLTLSGTSAAVSDPATVSLANGGLSVALTWASGDDMNLEVRDPVGGAVNFRTTSVSSGGKLSGNVNGDCKNTTSNNPTETVSWPKGSVPGGSYEIIVYYNQACTKPAASQSFVVQISVDGKQLDPIRGTLYENQQYVSSFILTAADNVKINAGGANPNVYDRATLNDKIANAQPLGTQTEVTGTINRNNPIDSYSFQGVARQAVTITMARTTGSLDSVLFLIGPGGNQIAFNDDADTNTRDARLNAIDLPSDGRYVIIATRFGLQIGGTEGGYQLTIGGKGRVNIATASTNPTQAASAATQSASTTATSTDGSVTVSLTWNTKADMRLLIRNPSIPARSLFSDVTQLPDGGTMQNLGNLNCTKTTSSPQDLAVWPAERLPQPGVYEIQVWLINQCNEVLIPQYNLTVKVKGKEVINVNGSGDTGNPRSHYVTTFTLASDGNATAGTGGTFDQSIDNISDVQTALDTPTPIQYNTPVTDTLDKVIGYKVYSFDAKAGDRIRVDMRTKTGNLDPFLFLLGPDRKQLSANDDISAKDINAQIPPQTITVDGTYYIVAARYGASFGGTNGSYELRITPVAK